MLSREVWEKVNEIRYNRIKARLNSLKLKSNLNSSSLRATSRLRSRANDRDFMNLNRSRIRNRLSAGDIISAREERLNRDRFKALLEKYKKMQSNSSNLNSPMGSKRSIRERLLNIRSEAKGRNKCLANVREKIEDEHKALYLLNAYKNKQNTKSEAKGSNKCSASICEENEDEHKALYLLNAYKNK